MARKFRKFYGIFLTVLLPSPYYANGQETSKRNVVGTNHQEYILQTAWSRPTIKMRLDRQLTGKHGRVMMKSCTSECGNCKQSIVLQCQCDCNNIAVDLLPLCINFAQGFYMALNCSCLYCMVNCCSSSCSNDNK